MTILVAFGMPGVMSSWGFAALHSIADEVFGRHEIVQTDTLDGLREAAAKRSAPDIVVTSQFPEDALVDLLVRSGAPFIVFLEDVLDSVCYLARCTGEADLGVVRAVSASLACLAPVITHPKVLLVRRDLEEVGIDRLVGDICEHLKIDLPSAGIMRCLRHLGSGQDLASAALSSPPLFEEAAAALIGGYAPPSSEGWALPEKLRQMTRDVLEPAVRFGLPSIETVSIKWPQDTFLLGDDPDNSMTAAIDLTGRARCLIYGPYFHLPPGSWNARIFFNVDDETYGQIFTIEIHAAVLAGRLRVRPVGCGMFEAELPFEITDARTPIEIRLLMDSGAIEGSISGWSVTITAQGIADRSAPSCADAILQ